MIGFQVKRTLVLGVKSLWLHKLRSFLTVLGMVFGVFSVISMLAIGEGASYEAQEQIKQLGSTNIIIRSVMPPDDSSAGKATQSEVASYGLTYADIERIAQTIPTVQVTVPSRRVRKEVWRMNRRIDTAVYGTIPWFASTGNHRIIEGRFLTSDDLHNSNAVCVLEESTANALFPSGGALNETIKIGIDYYRVVGVMSMSSGGKTAAKDEGNAGVFIPLTTARSRWGNVLVTIRSGSTLFERVEIHEAIITVPTVDEVLDTAEVVRLTLKRAHNKQDYLLKVPLEELETAKKVQRTYDIVLGSIAAISLLVGGIGIMNIMLASVTERTREIGIRRALGAKRRHIVMQFLVETVLLSVFGGVVGVMFGMLAPLLIGHFAEMKTIVTVPSLVIAFGISVIVGIVCGVYPAQRAASMDPIEALRHE